MDRFTLIKLAVSGFVVYLIFGCECEAVPYDHVDVNQSVLPSLRQTNPSELTVAVTNTRTTFSTTTITSLQTVTSEVTLTPVVTSFASYTTVLSITLTNHIQSPLGGAMLNVGDTVCVQIINEAVVMPFKFQIAKFAVTSTVTFLPTLTCGVTSIVG
ncbi:hypothetical protein ACF0H5_011448 [Mactra antiquata]